LSIKIIYREKKREGKLEGKMAITYPKTADRRRKELPVLGMWEQHHAVARLLYLGHTNIEIAAMVGMTPTNISSIRNSPIIQNHIKEMIEEGDKELIDVRKRINEMAPRCVEVLEEMIDSGEGVSARTRADAAFKMLGLGGIVPPKNVNVKSLSVKTDLIDLIKQRAEEVEEEFIID